MNPNHIPRRPKGLDFRVTLNQGLHRGKARHVTVRGVASEAYARMKAMDLVGGGNGWGVVAAIPAKR